MNLYFDPEKISRYDKAGPRYTSYPTAVAFTPAFSATDYLQHTRQSNHLAGDKQHPKPLSLYFHIPFCDTICFYCACNKIATRDYSQADTYLEYLYREMTIQSSLFDQKRTVHQLHWGGGTPTFLSHSQIQSLMQRTRQLFTLLNNDKGDYSIEIDPRSVTPKTIGILREAGFNRFSLGVQDIDSNVQKAVNRIQPIEQTQAIIEACRDHHAKSISIDLIYGLPLQTVNGFAKTLQYIIDISPDRISLFNYAHLPQRFKPQRRIHVADLPSAKDKLIILQQSINRLTQAGYQYIGMDHFAKPEDELALAQQQGKLHRNFQGYTTHADCDLVAMGVSAISSVNHSYSQNSKQLDVYYKMLDSGGLPITRGVSLSEDDQLRRTIIQQLSCQFSLDINTIEETFQVDFGAYFARELDALARLEEDDLLTLRPGSIQVTPGGRLLIRHICMIFDRYLNTRHSEHASCFSRVI